MAQYKQNQSKHGGSDHGNGTQDLPHCARFHMQVVQATYTDGGTYHQQLQQARRDRIDEETKQCGLNSIQGHMCGV